MKKTALILLLLIFLAGIGLLYGFYVEPRLLTVNCVEIKNEVNDAAFSVAVFSDLHLGNGTEAEDIYRIAAEINKYDCDAVIFAGDLFHDYSEYTGSVSEVSDALMTINGKKYAVWGNHDVGRGTKAYGYVLSNGGFTLLCDERVELMPGVTVTGANESIFYTPHVEGLETEGFDILLSHEPVLFDNGYGFELQISGHTHGGQINLPFVAEKFLPSGCGDYLAGRYEDDGRVLYVNRGIGMSWIKARIFSVPEITVLEVRP